MGRFTVPFNPDTNTPLPRPFILEGEGKGVKPVSMKPHAPPKKPKLPANPDDTLPQNPEDLYGIKWFKQFKAIEGKGRIGFGTVSLVKFSKKLAQSLLGSKATGGNYIRLQTGWKYNVLSGKMDIPVYQYERVSKAFIETWKYGRPVWGADPKLALKFASQLYRYGLIKDYKSLKKWIIDTALRIRDDQKKAYYIWRNQQVNDYWAYVDKYKDYYQ